tara:strand:+ start:116568 stop:117431 length:864 start_codon:yes stop_codon:yes gene_type:complete
MSSRSLTESQSWVIFTDLDGTLLDHHSYSFAEAEPALRLLRDRNIPWLFNTSKTFAELKQLRIEIGNNWPMLIENGSGIAVPENSVCQEFFARSPFLEFSEPIIKDGFRFYALGLWRQEFLPKLAFLKRDFDFISYSEMDAKTLITHTGLTNQQALNSLDRQFTEPCLWQDTEQAFTKFSSRIEDLGLHCVRGGRFAHIMGKSDKGRALKWVMDELYSGPKVSTLALGDGENDLSMLNKADVAVLVRSPEHNLPGPCLAPVCSNTDKEGPAGWAGAIIAAIGETSSN